MNERAPESGRLPAVPPFWFDGLTGGEMSPNVAAAAALDDFADALRRAPCWVLETGSGGIVTPRVCSHRRGERLEVLAELAGESMEIVLEPDASGWLSIAATCRGQEVFRAWLDHPYEEYELWPEGDAIPTRRNVDAPGRIGKRRNWINVSAAAWPPASAWRARRAISRISSPAGHDEARRHRHRAQQSHPPPLRTTAGNRERVLQDSARPCTEMSTGTHAFACTPS